MKQKLKAGETVVVIAGDAKGRQGRVMQVLPRKQRVLLEALDGGEGASSFINPVTKAEKKTQKSEGGLVQREASVHLSNVMKLAVYEARQTRKQKA